MKNENWSTKEQKIFVSSRLPQSPATGYVKPELKKVAVKIKPDSEDFVPKYSDKNVADLVANLNFENLELTSGSHEIIDCGIELEIPAGYKCCVSSCIQGLFLNLIEGSRIKVVALNCGKKLILKNKQVIGKIWIEPVYFFEWITKG